jgi:hypothetical protein
MARPSAAAPERCQSPDLARTRKRPGVDAPTFFLHWILVLTLAVSLMTGLRIASDDASTRVGALARSFLPILPEGAVIEWHIASSWILTSAAFAYAVFILRSRQTARLRLKRVDLLILWRSRDPNEPSPRRPGWFVTNRLLFHTSFALVALLAVTGWMLYHGVHAGVPAGRLRSIHAILALSFPAYLALHVVAVIKIGTFGRIFRPRLRHAPAALAGIVATGGVVGSSYLSDRTLHRELRVAYVSALPPFSDAGTDPVWLEAVPVTVLTTRGANLPGGEAAVEVRAVHDGHSIHFLFSWPDPQRSRKMTPLIRREDGWQVLQSGLDTNDENEYYEDKFAAIFAYFPTLGSGTVHLGQDLVPGPHYRNPRGLHYTRDGSIIDLWHWKSVRGGAMSPGYIDDNHIGPPMASDVAGARYTGGYTQDPPGAPHPYLQNWVKVDPDLPLSAGHVTPRFLPTDPTLLRRMDPVDLHPTAHDDGVWHLDRAEVVPYQLELDHYPAGTVLPGVVIDGTFTGDRADVRAEARWSDGRWTLEARRLLDTGSPYDIAFSPDRDMFLWVAVFNHSQTRHSQHLQPLRMVLEPAR